MKANIPIEQIQFGYRATNSATGVTRDTAKSLARKLGVNETQVIHLALHQMAIKHLPQYEAEDGPLSAVQIRQIKALVSQTKPRTIRSSLFETK